MQTAQPSFPPTTTTNNMGQTASTSYGETHRAPAAACPPAGRALHEELPMAIRASKNEVRYGTTLDEINAEFDKIKAKHEAVSSDKERVIRIVLDEINAEFDKINAKHEAASTDKAPERVLRIALDEINAEFDKINTDKEERELSRRPTLEGSSEEASVTAAAAAKYERALEIDSPRHATHFESALELHGHKRAAFEKFINEQHGFEDFVSV